ncbi:hypothetical protein HEB94_008433 [Actinopolymorpha pittospori]|uniref:Uncharacterized protein n=1 Tax=Actinopolymorpha pittospori TaxID=648752 RepID=A0A927N2Q9_9ACTN|nr:hypothetical protein [Actinopolymorpha pittospori]
MHQHRGAPHDPRPSIVRGARADGREVRPRARPGSR